MIIGIDNSFMRKYLKTIGFNGIDFIKLKPNNCFEHNYDTGFMVQDGKFEMAFFKVGYVKYLYNLKVDNLNCVLNCNGHECGDYSDMWKAYLKDKPPVIQQAFSYKKGTTKQNINREKI